MRNQSFAGNTSEVALHQPKRVSEAIYLLVSNNYATYYELKYKYDINDFLDLFEICMVSIYNKNAVINERS